MRLSNAALPAAAQATAQAALSGNAGAAAIALANATTQQQARDQASALAAAYVQGKPCYVPPECSQEFGCSMRWAYSVVIACVQTLPEQVYHIIFVWI